MLERVINAELADTVMNRIRISWKTKPYNVAGAYHIYITEKRCLHLQGEDKFLRNDGNCRLGFTV